MRLLYDTNGPVEISNLLCSTTANSNSLNILVSFALVGGGGGAEI